MTRRGRRLITSLCIAAALLLPLGAQLHALSHALAALQQGSQSDSKAPHTQSPCDECLLYAAIGSALPARAVVLPLLAAEATLPLPAALPRRAEPFAAYASRAPPPAG
jgi:hypothetical protein